ncbi:MAG: site-2 protease family protein [Clostridia bacterium]|nr:site-2 protease family protein [Clostridia bacterium]
MLLSFISSYLSGTSIKLLLANILLSIPVILFALSAHEAAHGFIANKCGDPTAKLLGRVSLNPLKHLDPLGTICMLVVGYGWAKPVPIDPSRFKNPKKGMALSAAAGPLCNLVLGFLNALLAGAFYPIAIYAGMRDVPMFVFYVLYALFQLFALGTIYNFVFAIFNLIPLPPFDGSRILYAVLPEKWYFGVMKYERYIMMTTLIVFLALFRFGWSPVSLLADFLTDKSINLFVKLFNPLFYSLFF